MKNIFKLTIATVFSIASISALTAQNYQGTLETIAPDARSAGLADIGAATSPDAFSQHWNLAKYALANDTAAIGLSYVPWMWQADDFSSHLFYLSGFYKMGTQALSASVRYMAGDADYRTPDGASYASPSLSQYSFDIGYSRSFGKYFSTGLAVRYISVPKPEDNGNGIYGNSHAGALAADLGLYFQHNAGKNDEYALGLSFKNMGSKINLGNEKKFLPMCMNFGFRYSWAIDKKNALSFLLDVNKPLVPKNDSVSVFKGFFTAFGNNIKDWGLSGGLEYAYAKYIFARAGYHLGSKDSLYGAGSYVSAGLGARWSHVALDGSYMLSTSSIAAMTNTFRISLQYTFGGGGK